MDWIFLILLVSYIAFELYNYAYFNGSEFNTIKDSIVKHTNDCNELNHHIEELKSSYVSIKAYDYGQGDLQDNSSYNFKRSKWKNYSKNSRIHNCSMAVLSNVRNQPLKYLCKYFNIKQDEDSLIGIEEVLNAFSAAEQGKDLLVKERDEIVNGIKDSVPWLIYSLAKNRLVRKLGFESVDLGDLYFPLFTFQYISSGGNSSAKFDIKLNIQNLENLVNYLGDLVKFRKTIQGQRALMTTNLREKIKSRDNYCCKLCHISVNDEPNLLLEIDHIIPLAKGGITSENNLQTLCWRCNRSKGAKLQQI